MCSQEELSEKVDVLGDQMDGLTKKLRGLEKDADLFKSGLTVLNETVAEIKKYKDAVMLKQMEEDIAVLAIMKDLQESVNKVQDEVISLTQQSEQRPCYVNPDLYKKIMTDLDNEVIDTKGRLFLILDHEGVVQVINPNGCQLMGRKAEEIVGKHWIDTFVPLEERAYVSEVFKSLADGRLNGYDTVINGVLASYGTVKVKWKNYIFKDKESEISAIISMGSVQEEQLPGLKGIA